MISTNKPAVLGGIPEFDKVYHLVKPLVPPISEFKKGIKKLSETRIFSNQGYYVKSLEKSLAKFFDVNYCALFTNATIAEMCLFKCLNIKKYILVPSFTFPATVQALNWIGLKTKFVDIDKNTLLMDPQQVNQVMSDDISVILPANLFGGCCQHDEMRSIANKYNVPLIYDSAQAFGSKYKGKMVGSLGDAEFFSFHSTKVFHTGEGGAVVTNNKDLYNKLCKIRSFGFNQYLNFSEVGINGKMNEFSALIGLCLLKDFDKYLLKRKKVYNYYIKSISSIDGIEPYNINKFENLEPNFSYFCISVNSEIYGLNNRELYSALIMDNIISRCYFFPPVHRSEYYAKHNKLLNVNLPNSDNASFSTLVLPFNSEMTFAEVDKIVFALQKCHVHSEAIKKVVEFKVPKTWQDLYSHRYDDPYDKFLSSQ